MHNNWIVVGRIGKTHGVKGELKIISFTQPFNNIIDYQPWYLSVDKKWQEITLASCKKQHDSVVAKLVNCDTPEQAKQYTNQLIAVPRSRLKELPAGDYYWADLQGLTVINKQNVCLGLVDCLLETGANDVLIVKNEETHKEFYIPYVMNEVILAVDLTEKVIRVDWDGEYI